MRALADVICYWKITYVVALDSVTSFFWKTLQIHVNLFDTVRLLAGILQCNGGKLKEAEDFKCVIVIYCVLNLKYIRSSVWIAG